MNLGRTLTNLTALFNFGKRMSEIASMKIVKKARNDER